MVDDLSSIRLLRLPDILNLIPISGSSWWAGIKMGKYPEGIKIASRTTVWREKDIRRLIEQMCSGDWDGQWKVEDIRSPIAQIGEGNE